MIDVVSSGVRSRMMAGIRGKNTKPELLLRCGLHRAGFRFRLHERSLSGRPDMTFAKYHAVIFAHGCFWHGHDCHLFRMPMSRSGFWRKKIEGNKERDRVVKSNLTKGGWRVLTVWECALKGRGRRSPDDVIARCV